jgi:hypothetical protein
VPKVASRMIFLAKKGPASHQNPSVTESPTPADRCSGISTVLNPVTLIPPTEHVQLFYHLAVIESGREMHRPASAPCYYVDVHVTTCRREMHDARAGSSAATTCGTTNARNLSP